MELTAVQERPTRLDTWVKRDQSISVCLPAKDEETTIGAALGVLMAMHRMGYVEQVAVIVQGADFTAQVAESFGAEVYQADELCGELGPCQGKGDNMWRALTVLTGDVVLYLDADSTTIQRHYVLGMCGPILRGEAEFVKGHYRRPLGSDPDGGARLNHLFGRPLLRAFFPALSWMEQPLAGETALTRDLAWQLPFEVGMAVEPTLCIDAHLAGASMTQVDLGVHEHRHWPLRKLADRTDEAMAAVLIKAGIVARDLDYHRPARPSMTEYREVVTA